MYLCVRTPLLLLLFFFIINISHCIPVVNEKESSGASSPEQIYGVILDAGSSGTRAHVFMWPKRFGYKIPEITELSLAKDRSQTRPGISSFYPNVAGLANNLNPILNYSISLIPQSVRWESATFLKATAGMRLLNDSAQQEVLTEVRRVISSYPWYFMSEWAKVISGQEEGVFGWVSANYLTNSSFVLDPSYDVWGVIDMGGASMQITFIPENPPLLHGYNITVGVVRQVYTWSYLYFGQDQAKIRHYELLIKDQQTPIKSDPCLLKGYSYNHASGNMTYQIVGSGNFTQCEERTYLLLNKSSPCESDTGCGINGIYTPPIRGKFYAISSFAFTWSFFRLESNASIAKLEEAAQEFCSLEWSAAVQRYPTVDASFLSGYCFASYYIKNVLVKGFGFDINSPNLIVTTTINSVSLDWTLGSMLYEVGILPWKLDCMVISTKSECDQSFGCRWIGSSCVSNYATGLSLTFPLVVLTLLLLFLI